MTRFATVCALLVTLLIVTTQRHDQELARKREQAHAARMAVLTEKKIAKVIALLEEQRRDSPFLPAREDAAATEMTRPTDPHASLDRIEAAQPGAERS